jgi:hypothetical protein
MRKGLIRRQDRESDSRSSKVLPAALRLAREFPISTSELLRGRRGSSEMNSLRSARRAFDLPSGGGAQSEGFSYFEPRGGAFVSSKPAIKAASVGGLINPS